MLLEAQSFKTLQIIFLVIAPLIILGIIFIIIYIPIKKRLVKNKFREYYYRKIYDIAKNQDYFLINNFAFRIDNGKTALIDHILFGEKYIYLILDYYYEGDITGTVNDTSLIYIPTRGKKCYTDNPLLRNKRLLSRFSLITDLEQSMLIGIVLVNDECHIGVESHDKQYYFIQRQKLPKLIAAIESRNIDKINQVELEKAVKAIDKLNRKKRR